MLRLQTYHHYSAPDTGSYCTLEGKPSLRMEVADKANPRLQEGHNKGIDSALIDWARMCVGDL